jgi:hypothetical protein
LTKNLRRKKQSLSLKFKRNLHKAIIGIWSELLGCRRIRWFECQEFAKLAAGGDYQSAQSRNTTAHHEYKGSIVMGQIGELADKLPLPQKKEVLIKQPPGSIHG